MSHPPKKNPVSAILGTQYPIMLGAMRLITHAKLAAAVSNAGGFGLIAASGMDVETMRRVLGEAQTLTDKPLGINAPIYRPNAPELIQAAAEMGVKTINTSGGNPAKIIKVVKDNGLKIVHKVSSLTMALKAQEAGVDAVTAMGFEAGGHVGREHVTTLCLVPQLVDHLDIPVIAAGGIADARGAAAAFALGALGVEMGTRFAACTESEAPLFYKQSLANADCEATLIMGKKAMPVRVLKNAATNRIAGAENEEENPSGAKPAQPIYVMSGGDAQTAVMPCGQTAGLIRGEKSVREIIEEITEGIRRIAGKMEDDFFL
ncbi:enoyl-[acyl-carrier protein] reductase II [Desulfatibacillum alkenivorans DSM 16219]|uniref:Enoyl-[acyl-carrier protein] reductase II n=1 Tax=Desulfatibacillum alkenivorans DSM 16219 TaxID=1121393 RepID=A0A1M6MB06_9BACT|nr:nitronate monooxygenase [Desulfatibacillum alkenivorans]SHJ80493.1 enoyl-[acyl-carrier protein] reductase II [Desulfatibacillum alkenivorans DSM 16219]